MPPSWSRLGEAVFDVIELARRLREVTGIGAVEPVASRTLGRTEGRREIMVFLHEHGVGTARAVRIYRTTAPTRSR